MIGFKEYLREEADDRSSQLAWGQSDVSHDGTDVTEDAAHHFPQFHDTEEKTQRHHDPHEVGEMFKAHHDHLMSPEHDGATLHHLIEYKEKSTDYNDHLRKGGMPMDNEKLQYHHMDHMTSHPFSKDLHVYRGLHHVPPKGNTSQYGYHTREHVEKQWPVGKKFQDKGYTGTSLNPVRASSFSEKLIKNHDGSPGGKRVLFKIHAPAGTKGHFLDMHKDSPFSSEEEVTLQRGTKFQVQGHSQTKDHHLIHVRVIGNKHHAWDESAP